MGVKRDSKGAIAGGHSNGCTREWESISSILDRGCDPMWYVEWI